MSEDLKRIVKSLCSQYGYTEVYGTVMDHMRHTFVELDKFFRPDEEGKTLVLSPKTTAPQTAAKKENKVIVPAQPPQPPQEVKKQVVSAEKIVADILNSPPKNKPEEVDKKTHHKMAIDKRVAELRSQGKEAPFPLLTQENMTQWIEKDGLTYWKIAEMTGATDLQVSSVAKMYRLQSNASKMIMFKKNSGN